MPSWNELLNEFQAVPDDEGKGAWMVAKQTKALQAIGTRRGDRNVLLYASAFLQKPQAPAQLIQLTAEELNGLMSAVYGMDWSKGLSLILHTPGGITNAAETFVAYLRSKFEYIEAFIPTFAMSAGTMVSLATNKVVMGRQSQMGPIDPQMPVGGRFVSARAIVEQFEQAKAEILQDVTAAHAWAPVLQSLGPALLQEAQNALEYGERMVGRWLANYMLAGVKAPVREGRKVARHFNDASTHKSHGRRIDRDEARSNGVVVDDLEDDQELQDLVLSSYHLMTLTFEHSPATKFIWTSTGRSWIKNWGGPAP